MKDILTLKKNPETKVWEMSAPESEAEPTAELAQAGVLAGIDQFEISGIKVGAGILGGTVALVTSELVDGIVRLEGFAGSLVKLIAAGALLRFGSGILGKTATTYAGAFIAFDVARSILPIDTGISSLLGRFGGGQGRTNARPPRADDAINAQATQIARDYYAKAFGG